MARVALALALCFSFPGIARAADGKNAVAVLDIQGTGVDPGLLPTLTEILTAELAAIGSYKVIAGRDIQSMLGFEKQKDVLGCTDAACLAEIGGALGVDRIVASHIGLVGSTYVVNIKLINIKMADTEARVYETVRGEQDALIHTVRASVAKLLGRSAPAASASDAPVKTKQAVADAHDEDASPVAVKHKADGPGKPIPTLSYVLGGVGAAGVVLGIVMGVSANGDAKDAEDPSIPGAQVKAQLATRKATVANIGIFGGIALVGAGVLVYALSDDAPAVAVAPMLGESTGLALSGRF